MVACSCMGGCCVESCVQPSKVPQRSYVPKTKKQKKKKQEVIINCFVQYSHSAVGNDSYTLIPKQLRSRLLLYKITWIDV